MKTTECTCQLCGIKFNKPTNEYNRIIKFNKKTFCSRKCAGINNSGNFGDKANRIPPINKYKANPFKYYLRGASKRFKECNLDLEYLEQLWNTQQGICPYIKTKLVLNNHSKRDLDFRFTASLDRIDSSIGYIKGNVQFISTAINYMKNTMSHNQTIEFLNFIKNNS